MRDKVTIGFIAGITGGFVMNVLDFILVYLFRWADVSYLDYAAIYIFGNQPTFWLDTLFALLIQIIFTGLLGIGFYYLISLISGKYHLLKGGSFGAAAWFCFYTVGFLFRLPLFTKTSWQTAISDLGTSIVYGLVLAEALRRLIIKYFGVMEWQGNYMMKDRFMNGFIAGVAGGIVQTILDFALQALGFGKIRYLDYAAIVIYGNRPTFWLDTLFAQIAYLGFAGFAGIVFAFIIVQIKEKNYLLKGWLFAVAFWFSIYAIGLMLKVPLMQKVPWPDAISNFISTSFWGLVSAALLQRLTLNRAKT